METPIDLSSDLNILFMFIEIKAEINLIIFDSLKMGIY